MGVQPDFHAVVVPRLTAPRLAAVRTDLPATVEAGGDVLERFTVTRASAVTPFLNRHTATLPIWRVFLGTFRPQHGILCCGLKWLRSARGFDVVAVLRFVYPLGA